MIEKVIHYCWFGKGEMSNKMKKCLNSWKKYCPNYRIIEWNEDNFEIESTQWTKEAYAVKKYAFVSDYVRLKVLYEHGGIYMDTDVEVLGYNIFDRIAKEGRKYGILLGVITQRPSELSTTTLSQCSNFITFKMFHPSDINIISNISSNVSVETIEKIKNLLPGTAIVFGTSFKVPLIVRLDLPNPMPKSTSVDIVSKWY